MHHVYKRKAVALLGRALERAGWRLLGWKRDESDMSTDHWSPEAWDGVAVLALPDGRRRRGREACREHAEGGLTHAAH